ncbi:MAG: hypothetical protein ABIO37_02720 [Caulobacteraceae bacterium]
MIARLDRHDIASSAFNHAHGRADGAAMFQTGWLRADGAPVRRTGAVAFLLSLLRWCAALLSAVVVTIIGAVLMVVFAAAVAVSALLAAVLLTVSSLTRRRGRRDSGIIEARNVGHAWVAYGWDQRPR